MNAPLAPDSPGSTGAPLPAAAGSSLSMRARVVLMVALVLTVFSALCSTVVVRTARAAILEEVEAGMSLARSLSEALVRTVARNEAGTDLAALVGTLSTIRHVRISYRSGRADDWLAYAASLETPSTAVPRWFERLVLPSALPAHVILRVSSPHHGMLILAPYADDELLESWYEARTWLLFLGLTTLGACAATFVVVGRSLRPLAALDAALKRIQGGDLAARLRGPAVPEIARLNLRFNDMAASLHQTTDENRRLTRALAEAQTRERQWLARELHDEMSPKLFKIRVDLHGATTQLGADGVGGSALARLDSARQLVVHLQQWVRRLLRDLYPLVLDELGLAAAAHELVEDWRRRQPDVDWHFEETLGDLQLDATTISNVYRIAEEALVNAARHADASRIGLALAFEQESRDDGPRTWLRLVVEDDGVGDLAELRPGIGLRSMRDRARSLGGDCIVEARHPQGLRVAVIVPVAPAITAGGADSAADASARGDGE